MDKYAQHQELLVKTTLYIQKELPEIRFFTRHVGKFYYSRLIVAMKSIVNMRDFAAFMKSHFQYMLTINKKGMSDQYAIYTHTTESGFKLPIHIEIETKSGKSRLSKDQIWWRGICEKRSIKFIESRDQEQTLNELKAYIENIKDGIK